MLFHTKLTMELETHPLLLISAEVPHQCVISAKYLRSLRFKVLVPTATITQLFTSIVFANIPCTCIFCYSIPHSFLFQTASSSSLHTLLCDPSFHMYSCLCSPEPPFCNLSVPHSSGLCHHRVCPTNLSSSHTFCTCFHVTKSP